MQTLSIGSHTSNAFSFSYVKNSYGRQDKDMLSGRSMQEFWKAESDEKKDSILKEAFRS